MAKIIGGIATSHTPTIGFAYDTHKQKDPVWAPIFEAYQPAMDWLKKNKPDVMVYIYNDHVTSFFFDHYSAFCLGIGEKYEVADEGGGPRDLPPIKGHSALARHIGFCLVAEEFDMAFFQEKSMDHGFFSPMSVLTSPSKTDWPMPVVPLQVGVLQFPIPSAARCYKLGHALRRAIESYPEDLKVVVVATGGLSHQVHGERCGFNNEEWDAQFLEMFEKDPEKLTQITHAEYATLGGLEGAEVIMWLIMRGALSPNVRKIHQDYYLPSMTGIAIGVYENLAIEPPVDTTRDYLRQVGHQLAGAEKLEGTYPFTLERSVKSYRLNKFLHELIVPGHRERFLNDKEALFEDWKLPEVERDMLRRLDWQALIRYGVIFFMLEKLGAVVGVSNLHIYAAMRGQTLEEFQKTRKTKALYSVAGKEGTKDLQWDKESEQA